MAVRIDVSYIEYKDSPEASEVSQKASKNIWLMLFFGGLFFISSAPIYLAPFGGYFDKVEEPVAGFITFLTINILSGALLYYGLRVYPKKINKKIDDILARNETLDQRVHDYYNQNEKKDK